MKVGLSCHFLGGYEDHANENGPQSSDQWDEGMDSFFFSRR